MKRKFVFIILASCLLLCSCSSKTYEIKYKELTLEIPTVFKYDGENENGLVSYYDNKNHYMLNLYKAERDTDTIEQEVAATYGYWQEYQTVDIDGHETTIVTEKTLLDPETQKTLYHKTYDIYTDKYIYEVNFTSERAKFPDKKIMKTAKLQEENDAK